MPVAINYAREVILSKVHSSYQVGDDEVNGVRFDSRTDLGIMISSLAVELKRKIHSWSPSIKLNIE